MTSDRSYRRAVATLSRPNPRLTAALEAGRIEANAARDAVRALLDAGGDAEALYRAETDRTRRIVLLGVLRRGRAALEHS